MQQRLPSLLDPPITFAHRGARAHAQENTVEAFELALRLGATGIESDVWLTSDGVPVLDHDGVVKRGIRRRPIREVRYEDLPDHVPTLADLLEIGDAHVPISLDLKDPDATDVVVEQVRIRQPERLGRLWLCDPDVDRLVAARPRLPEVHLVNSVRLERIKEGPERRAAMLARHGIDAVNMHRTDWNGGLVALFHRFELLAFSWDLQMEHQLREAFRMGVDAVYSDTVDVMQEAFRGEIGSVG